MDIMTKKKMNRENEYEVRFCPESRRLSFVRIEDGEVFDDFEIPPEAAVVVARVIIDFALTDAVIDRRCGPQVVKAKKAFWGDE